MLSDLLTQLLISAARDLISRRVNGRRTVMLRDGAYYAWRVLRDVPDEHLSEKQLRMRAMRRFP